MTGQRCNAFGLLGVVLLLLVPLLTTGCSSNNTVESNEMLYPATSDAGSLDVVTVTKPGFTCPSTNIVFELPQAGYVYLELTNATGYHVRTLLDEEMFAGSYAIPWDGKNDDGEDIDPGIYLFHLEASAFEAWHPFPIGISIDSGGES